MMDESAFSGLPDLFGGQNQFSQNLFSPQPEASPFGGITSIPLDLQTELKRLSLMKSPLVPPQQPQDSNPLMSALGLGPATSVASGLNASPAGPNLVGSAAGVIPGGAAFYALFNNPTFQRYFSKIGDDILQPLANVGGNFSLQHLLDQLNKHGGTNPISRIVGAGSGHTPFTKATQ